MDIPRDTEILILFSSPPGKTIAPDLDMEISSLLVRGEGPGSTFEKTAENRMCTVRGVEPGEWVISAEAFNNGGIQVGEGLAAVTVREKETVSLEIIITPMGGYGSFSAAVSWSEIIVSDPSLIMSLKNSDGVLYEPAVVIADSAASAEQDNIPGGYYLLDCTLYDGEEKTASLREVVRIAAGQTTEADIELRTTTGSGGIFEVTFVDNMLMPLELVLSVWAGRAFRGEVLHPEVTALEDPGGIEYKWYCNGTLVGEGSECTLDTSLLDDMNRLDITAFTSGGDRGGSLTEVLEVIDPVFAGSLAWFQTVYDGEEENDGLRGVRTAVLRNEGKELFTAAYDEDSIGWFQLEPGPGGIEFMKEIAISGDPSFQGIGDLAISPSGTLLACSAARGGGVYIFSLDNQSYALFDYRTVLDHGGDAPESPSGLCFSPDGSVLYVCDETGNALYIYTVGSGGISFSGTLESSAFTGGNFETPRKIVVFPDNKLVGITCFTGDCFFLCEVSPGDWADVSPVEAFRDGSAGVESLNGVEGVAVSPDESSIYLVSFYDNSITHLRRDAVHGIYVPGEVIGHGDFGIQGLQYAKGTAVSPEGTELYVTASGGDMLTVFNRSIVDGSLSFEGEFGERGLPAGGMEGPRGMAVDSAGNLYAAAAGSNGLVHFRRGL